MIMKARKPKSSPASRTEVRREGPAATQTLTTDSADVIDLVPACLNLKKILVPIDFSDDSRKALTYALRFAEQFGATITLLHVVEPIVYPAESGFVPVEMQTMAASMQTDAKTKLNALARQAIKPPLSGEALVRTGSPFHEIATLAKKLDMDLIIIGTHGYTGLKHLFLGSTAERVVRYAPCPVLTVRQKEHEFI
jgi:nucleotide-binding universal stress UspA family protein